MSKTPSARRLDVRAFAQDAASLSARDPLQDYPRLAAEAQGDAPDCTVDWRATGRMRPVRGGADEVWLHLQAEAAVPLTCQRCLTPVRLEFGFERDFRFARDEATAAQEDEDAEEDVLAISPTFDLHELIEDELLMELPLVPRHEVCPVDVKLAVADPDFEAAQAARDNPFAKLARLKE
jgi:uncharacterized protein